MKLKSLILFIAVLVLSSSCKTYQASWYNPDQSLSPEFSFKEVSSNKRSIQQAFSRNPSGIKGIKSTMNTGHNSISITYSSTYSTKSSKDALTMINNYFDKSSENSTVLPYRLEISVYKTEHKINKAYLFVSCLTATTINILGFPFIGHKTKIVVKGDVYDYNEKLIKTYTVNGDAKAKSAYYWGYFGGASIRNDGDATLCRVVNSLALKDALNKLRNNIYNDLGIFEPEDSQK